MPLVRSSDLSGACPGGSLVHEDVLERILFQYTVSDNLLPAVIGLIETVCSAAH